MTFSQLVRDMNCFKGVFRPKSSSLASSERYYPSRVTEQAPDQFVAPARAEKPKKKFSLKWPLGKSSKKAAANQPVTQNLPPSYHDAIQTRPSTRFDSNGVPVGSERGASVTLSVTHQEQWTNSSVRPPQNSNFVSYGHGSSPNHQQPWSNNGVASMANTFPVGHYPPRSQAPSARNRLTVSSHDGSSLPSSQRPSERGHQPVVQGDRSQPYTHAPAFQPTLPRFSSEEEAVAYTLRHSEVTAEQESEKRAATLAAEHRAVEDLLGNGRQGAPVVPQQTAEQAAEEAANLQKALKASIQEQQALENEQKAAFERLTKVHTPKTEQAEPLKPGQLIPVDSMPSAHVEPNNNPWAGEMTHNSMPVANPEPATNWWEDDNVDLVIAARAHLLD